MPTRTIAGSFGIIYIFFAVLFTHSSEAAERSKAVYFTDKEGLPRNIVSCFVQDAYGYGWIGTGNGISRFDGYKFINYDNFKGHFINSMVVDPNNELWVGTDDAFFHYNRLDDSFDLLEEGYTKSLSAVDGKIYYQMVNRLVQRNPDGSRTSYDIDGLICYAATSEGIWYCADRGLKKIGSDVLEMPGRVISLIKEVDDVLWIACRNGDVFYRSEGNLKKVNLTNHYNVMDIEKIDDNIWIATDGGGIIILNENLEPHSTLKKEQNKESLIPSNSIYDLSSGIDDAVWISTYGGGLTLLIAESNAFRNILPMPGTGNSLVDKEGVSACVKGDTYFLGTNYGISVWNQKTNRFRNINSENLEKQINGRKATAINIDSDNNLWVGTYDGLVGKYTADLRLQKTYHPCSENDGEMQQVIFIYDYDDEHLLIGSHYRNKSLLRFNKRSGEAEPVKLEFRTPNKYYYQANNVRVNKFGETVVLIRNVGIFLYNAENNTLENFLPEINNRITFRLNDFYHDKTGNYWFATQADGLVKMSPDGRVFERWTMKDGFPTNTLLSIESIDNKTLWISTIDGLCRFNTSNNQIQIFNYRHGLASNEFLPRTSKITEDKNILFGNSEGFVLLEPDKLVQDTAKSIVVISDISFHNQSIKNLGEEHYLDVPLEEANSLRLPFKRNSFTISFFTRDNDLPKFSNYAYMLEGLETDWIYLGENNQTTYTNLSPGSYTFKVKCTNKSNIWNEVPTELTINISSPWYATRLAMVAYFLLFGIVLFVFLYFYNKRLQWKKDLEISEFKVQSEHALTEKKLAFFTNISHDLKTPLTLISAPVNDLMQAKNLEPEQKSKLTVIDRNAKRLYKLITDLIEFRKITQNQLPLKIRTVELEPAIENIREAFKAECDKRNISLDYSFKVKDPVHVDLRKIEKILWNLLSNAVKYTGDGGTVSLRIKTENKEGGKWLRMNVGDSGKGFGEEEKQRIFDRFYQVQHTENLKFEGSGIGLSIVSDLVKIHHGTIDVDSTPGKGSEFTILLPCDENYFSQEERWDDEQAPQENQLLSSLVIDDEPIQDDETGTESKKYSLQKMLIVEDNHELRDYLCAHFKGAYKVIKAPDGEAGFRMASEEEPDIVITDVNMPKMNGHEFCRKLRGNFGTSHIPVVMLTANSAIEQKVEGLSSGVDVYVTKPFDIKYLDAVVASLLRNRRRIREKFLGIEPVDHEKEKITGGDVAFANELKEFILNNITNEGLNIDLLSQHFAVSRTQLNRKIKALTGLTPNNYIKTIRLKKAYELIKTQGMRVAEAAYQTGFTDPNYFTICFKKEFGENPSKISDNPQN